MEWMILPLRRYFDFAGRSRRKEFWMFTLFVVVASMILSAFDAILGLGGATRSFASRTANSAAAGAALSGGILSSIFSIAVLIPSIAVSVRRLHDRDRSGWWLLLPYGCVALGFGITFAAAAGGGIGSAALGGLLSLVGVIASIVLFVWFCLDGTRGRNRFGADPKDDLGDLEATFR